MENVRWGECLIFIAPTGLCYQMTGSVFENIQNALLLAMLAVQYFIVPSFRVTCHYLPGEWIARKLHSSSFAHAPSVSENWRFSAQLLAARWQKKDKINWIRYIGCQELSWIWLDEMAWNFHTCCLHDKFCLKINLSLPVIHGKIDLIGAVNNGVHC